jgi:hypothetical protein
MDAGKAAAREQSGSGAVHARPRTGWAAGQHQQWVTALLEDDLPGGQPEA